MKIPVKPPKVIEYDDSVVVDLRIRAGHVFLKRGPAAYDNAPVGGRDNLRSSFRAAHVEPVMIVHALRRGFLGTIHVRRLVRHLRIGGEPALLYGIHVRAWAEKWRSRRPNSQPRVFLDGPWIRARIRQESLGDGAVDLHAPRRHREPIVPAFEPHLLTVHRHANARQPRRPAPGQSDR